MRCQPIKTGLSIFSNFVPRSCAVSSSLCFVFPMRDGRDRGWIRVGTGGRELGVQQIPCGRIELKSGHGVPQEIGGIHILVQRRIDADGDRLRACGESAETVQHAAGRRVDGQFESSELAAKTYVPVASTTTAEGALPVPKGLPATGARVPELAEKVRI